MKKMILAALPLMLSSAFAQASNIDINVKFTTDPLEEGVYCLHTNMNLLQIQQVICSDEDEFKPIGYTRPEHGELTSIIVKNKATDTAIQAGIMNFFAWHFGETAPITLENLHGIDIQRVDNNNYIFALKDLDGPKVKVFSEKNHEGNVFRFNEDVSDFGGFSLDVDSFIIPEGWRVRFYEGKDFTGGYYTRTSNDWNKDSKDFKPRVQSAKILNKPDNDK